MKTQDSVKLNTEDLARIFDIDHCRNNPRNFEKTISASPVIFRWLVKAEVCKYIIDKNAGDANLQHQWSQPLSVANQPGHFVVAAAVRAIDRWPNAARALMLPLQWSQTSHAAGVPRSLIEVANQIVERMRSSPRLIEQFQSVEARSRLSASWGLSWSISDWRDVDLSDLALSPESAWASLTIALASALLDRPLSDELLATGFWDSTTGKWSVGPETLAGKLSVGYSGGKRLFVVPSSVAQNVRGHFLTEGQQDAKVVELVDDSQDLYAGVLPGLLQAGAEPSASDPVQRQIDWYLARITNADADKYYYKVLLPAIAAARRNELVQTELENWRPETLISIVSTSEVLIPLTAFIFRPRQLQLIYTRDSARSGDMEGRFKKVRTWINANKAIYPGLADIDVLDPPLIIDDDLTALPEIVALVRDAYRATGESSVLIDTTPGKRAMQMALLQGAQHGDRILCWWHDTHQANRRAIPFSEKMLLWEVTADSSLRPLRLPSSHTEASRSKP